MLIKVFCVLSMLNKLPPGVCWGGGGGGGGGSHQKEVVEGCLGTPLLPSLLFYNNVGGRKERSGRGRPGSPISPIGTPLL